MLLVFIFGDVQIDRFKINCVKRRIDPSFCPVTSVAEALPTYVFTGSTLGFFVPAPAAIKK